MVSTFLATSLYSEPLMANISLGPRSTRLYSAVNRHRVARSETSAETRLFALGRFMRWQPSPRKNPWLSATR